MEKFWKMSDINIYELLCPVKTKYYESKRSKTYNKDEIIYFENALNKKIYLVSSGKVKLVNYNELGDEIIQHIILKGELFGENCLLQDYQHSEFAVACSNNTRICCTDIHTLHQLMMENKDFSSTVYKCLAFRRRKIGRRLELLIGKDVNTRIAAYIYDLYKDSENLKIKNSLTQAEIGKLLATSRESVARVFNELRDKGIIDYSRKYIYIKDLSELLQMSKAS